jgi:hypothetical protein
MDQDSKIKDGALSNESEAPTQRTQSRAGQKPQPGANGPSSKANS